MLITFMATGEEKTEDLAGVNLVSIIIKKPENMVMLTQLSM